MVMFFTCCVRLLSFGGICGFWRDLAFFRFAKAVCSSFRAVLASLLRAGASILVLLFLLLAALGVSFFFGAMTAVAQAGATGRVVVLEDVDGKVPAEFGAEVSVFFVLCDFSARARRYPAASDRFAKATRCTCVW